MQRRMVDTAQRSDSPSGEIWPPGPGVPARSAAAAVYHISVDDHMTQARQYDPDAPQTRPAPPPGFGRRAYLDDLSTPPTGGSLPPTERKIGNLFRASHAMSRRFVNLLTLSERMSLTPTGTPSQIAVADPAG
jgi:hypothetical protein